MDHLELESHTWPRLLQLKLTLHFSGDIFVSSPSAIFVALFYVCVHTQKIRVDRMIVYASVMLMYTWNVQEYGVIFIVTLNFQKPFLA